MLSVIKHAGKQAGKQSGKEAGKPAGKEARAIIKVVRAMPFGGLLFLELKGEGSRERAQGRGLKKEGSRGRAQERAQERKLKRELKKHKNESSRGRSHALEGLVHSGKCFFLKF